MSTPKRLPRWVRQWLAEWPVGTERELSSRRNYVTFGGHTRQVNLEVICDLGYVRTNGRDGWTTTFERTDKPIRLNASRPRTTSTGPWPWPIPHHLRLVRNSPFAQHLQWVQTLGQELDEAIAGPQLRFQWSGRTRLRIVRRWLQTAGNAYTPTWLEKHSSPMYVPIWCAILLVRPVRHTAAGWTFEPLDPEEAKQQLLSSAAGTVNDALNRLTER